MKIDVYASENHYVDHIAPIWLKLPDKYRGTFYVSKNSYQKAQSYNIDSIISLPIGLLTLVASYGDYRKTNGHVIFMEHGIGNTYSNDHPSYAGGMGKDRVVLFLNQHYYTQEKNINAYPSAKQAIIGTPKLDSINRDLNFTFNDKPNICLSFHWDCNVAPETKTAFEHYRGIIPFINMNKNFNLFFHGHPRDEKVWDNYCKKNNIKRIKDLSKVFEIADIYICDNSSSMYEFAATGKPVIVLNAPWYRKDINHGIRFWEFILGPQVDYPKDLFAVIDYMIKNPHCWDDVRNEIIDILYPNLGFATETAVKTIIDFLENL